MNQSSGKHLLARSAVVNGVVVLLLAGMLVAALAGRTTSYRRLSESLGELRGSLDSLTQRIQALEVGLAGLSASNDDLGRAVEALDHSLSVTASRVRRAALGREDGSPAHGIRTGEEISSGHSAAQIRLWSLEDLLQAFAVESDVPGAQRRELENLIRRFQALFDILRGRRGAKVDALVEIRNSSGDYRVVSESEVRSSGNMLDPTRIRVIKNVGSEMRLFDFDRDTYPELFLEFESGVEALKQQFLSETFLILSELGE